MKPDIEFRIAVISEEMFGDVLDEKIRTQLCMAFPHGAWYFKKSRGWKGAYPEWSILVFDRTEEPVGHIGVVKRLISIEQNNYQIFGLQNVYVLSKYRGKGLATRMLQEVEVMAKKNELDFGLLFCRPQVESLYVDVGWTSVGTPAVYITDDAGKQIIRPFVHDSLFFKAITVKSLPTGTILFNGPDW